MALTHINEKEFSQTIAKGSVLVDFYADWCGPCRMLTPILEELDTKLQGKITIVKVDVDNAQSLAQQFDITSVPTLLFFKDGNLKEKVIGLRDLNGLMKIVQ